MSLMLISLVVPCYNESEALRPFMVELTRVLDSMEGVDAEVILVDDGSRDNTLEVMQDVANQYPIVRWLSFSRNFGKEGAILAGLKVAKGDYAAVMDADLQDPPALLPDML